MADHYTIGGASGRPTHHATDAMGALEERALALGVEPITVLTARRRELVAEAAPLRALRDVWDAKRKSERGKVTVLLLNELREKKEKIPAADTLEMLASAHPLYVEVLDYAEAAFARLAILEDEIAGINDTILRQRDLLRMHAAEAHLEPMAA